MFCRIYCIVCCLLTAIGVQGQDSVLRKGKLVFDPTQKVILATASCGLCQLGLGGDDCRLAVRIKGRAYYVEGAGIDDFGDAHANDGFCNAVRKVQVQGSVVNNRFRLSWLKLLPTPISKRKATRAQQQRQ